MVTGLFSNWLFSSIFLRIFVKSQSIPMHAKFWFWDRQTENFVQWPFSLDASAVYLRAHLYPSKNFWAVYIVGVNPHICRIPYTSVLDRNWCVPLRQILFWVKWAVPDEIHLNNSHSSKVSTLLSPTNQQQPKKNMNRIQKKLFFSLSLPFILLFPCV